MIVLILIIVAVVLAMASGLWVAMVLVNTISRLSRKEVPQSRVAENTPRVPTR
jgi:flagellar basal body-associated protein FliL